MKVYSAGIAIIYDNKILLAHPTGQKDTMWGIPKGKIEEGESYLQTAIRETEEEIGVQVNPMLLFKKDFYTILYRNRNTKVVYKELYYYVLKIDSLEEIGLTSEIVDDSQLDKREIDKAYFMTYEEAKKKIFWRFKDIIKHLEREEKQKQ
jgi:8-oxo-dGTP pyrophosphatase MutT (NUDIX family)